MTARSDLTGFRSGRLVAVSFAFAKECRAHWLFRCDCGREVTMAGIRVTRSSRPILSCGCARRDATIAKFTTHGGSKTKTYAVYHAARRRCSNPKDRGYATYGGRGIRMCDRWVDDYGAFLADMGEAPPGFSLERKDTNGNYEPNNCEWIPLSAQQANRRDTVRVGPDGIPLRHFAALRRVNYSSLHRLVTYRGFTPEAAATRLASGDRSRPKRS